MTLKQRELKRQLFHIAFGVILVALFHFDIITLNLFTIIIIAGYIISIAWKKGADLIVGFFLKNFERNGYKPGIGAFWYCVGCYIVLAFFPKNIALASILILAFGDALSHHIGRFYGRIKHPLNKKINIEGTIVAILVGGAAASIFVPIIPAFVAAFIAMNGEVIDWGIDDNVIIPVVSAVVLLVMI